MRIASTTLPARLLAGLVGLLVLLLVLLGLVGLVSLAGLAGGCQRGKQQAVVIEPTPAQLDSQGVPAEPFGSASPAYARLRDVTNAALASKWSGALEDFAPWLEEETVAVERSLALLKALRLGPLDVYAVANGRIAMVYDSIASALTRASAEAAAAGFEADWKDEEGRVWEQASAFWARCVRGCSTGGTHLDGWDLRCQAGLANSEVKLGL